MDASNLKKFNFKFNKKYGQNFIFDQNFLRAVVDDADVKGLDVLEIGPGAGSLTYHLAQVANKVVSYEIDENLQPILQENLADCHNVTIHFGDIMKQNMEDIEANFEGDYVLVANLPYYITTPIIFKFLEQATRLKKMIIMVQYEVALRLTAKENTADYGAITVAIDTVANAKILRKVKRTMFVPAPNVDSAIVEIEMCNKWDIDNKSTLDKLIKCAFAMRRKTLANNLKSSFGLSVEQIKNLLTACNLSETIRGEALSTQQFVELANLIKTKTL